MVEPGQPPYLYSVARLSTFHPDIPKLGMDCSKFKLGQVELKSESGCPGLLGLFSNTARHPALQ